MSNVFTAMFKNEQEKYQKNKNGELDFYIFH
jgi:hypothetical protein